MSLEIKDVAAGYGRLNVLEGVSLTVGQGSIVSVVGANGAGKSTLAKTISGTLRATSGTLAVDDQRVDKLAADRRAKLGLIHVPEGRRLFGTLTVEENVQMGRRASRKRSQDTDVVDHLLDSFPIIRERWQQRAGLLSGGEQQMVALVRAAASRPRYLLLDEPSLGLSPRLSSEVFRLIALIARETNAGIMLIEQRVDAALRMADDAHVLEHGRIVASGTAEEIRVSDAVRRAYLGG